MKRPCPRFALIALAVISALNLSCDDDPTTAESECAAPNASCLSLTLTSDQMTHSPTHPTPGTTVHWLEWDLGSEYTFDYGPGQHVRIQINFDPPLTVRYDHPFENFGLTTEAGDIFWDRGAEAPVSLTTRHWITSASGASCYGLAESAEQAITAGIQFEPMVVDEELRILVIEFTVPDTYTIGDAHGTPVRPEVLTIRRVGMTTWVDGDDATNPPVWQGEFSARVQ